MDNRENLPMNLDDAQPQQEDDNDRETEQNQPSASQSSQGNASNRLAIAALRPASPDPYGLNAISESGAFAAMAASARELSRVVNRPSPLPRTTLTAQSNRPPLPRTVQTTSTSNDLPFPRIAMTVPSALLDEWRRAMPERERAKLNQRIEEVLAKLPTFAVDSDPSASGTHSTPALREARLKEDCPIAASSITRPCETVCGHIFQAEALAQAWLNQGACPMCRTPLLLQDIPARNYDMHLLEGETVEEGVVASN